MRQRSVNMSKTKSIVILSLGWLATLALGIIIGAAVMYKNYIFWDVQENQDCILMEIEKIKKEQEWVDFVSQSLEGLMEAIKTEDANLKTIKWWNYQMQEMGNKLEKEDKKNTAKKELTDFKDSHD